MTRYMSAITVLMLSICDVLPQQRRQPPVAPRPLTARQIAARVLPGVVLVVVERGSSDVSYGSGFVVTATEVITSRHVVEGARGGHVQIAGRADKYPLSSVFIDDRNDLALLTVRRLDAAPRTLGGEGEVEVGDDVYVVGNPKGYEGTFSRGVVSSLRRAENLIQFDAAISPGSSGGPLVDESGRVIGVVRGYTDGQNLNFAVPIAYVSRLIAAVRRDEVTDSMRTDKNALPSGAPRSTTASWVTVTGKQTDFTVEFPGEPRHEFRAPHLFSNTSVEQYGQCTSDVCLLVAVLWFGDSSRRTDLKDEITAEEQKQDDFARELAGWKVTKTTRLSESVYEVEGMAPLTNGGTSSFIVQRIMKRNGRTHKLTCQSVSSGEPDRRTCERFFASLRFATTP